MNTETPNQDTPQQDTREQHVPRGFVHVTYTSGGTSYTTKHKAITQETCAKHHASERFLFTTARLLEHKGTVLGKINSLFNKTRKDVGQMGILLPIGGVLVRTEHMQTIHKIFDESEDELHRLRGELRLQFHRLLEQSKANLGSSADTLNFPTAEEAAARPHQEIYTTPDPLVNNCCLDGMTEETAARVRAEQAQQSKDMLMHGHVALIHELLQFLNGNGQSDKGILGVLKEAKTLKSGRFKNLAHRLEMAKDLNYIDLPELDATIKLLEPIANADLDAARVDRTELIDAVAKAKTQTEETLANLGISL